MGMMVSVALMLHVFENFMPVPFIAPGAKLGLANIVTMFALYIFGFGEAMTVLILRVIMGSIFGGGLSGFLYSFTGGVLSLIAMYGVKTLFRDHVSIIGVSVTGAFFHSLGQVLMATFIIRNIKMLSYMPVLSIVSIVTGVFIGYTSKYFISYLNKADGTLAYFYRENNEQGQV